MYEAFFQLSRRPFLAAPTAAAYFASATHERSRQALARAIDRAEGTGLLIGPAGTGKTLLLQVLAEQCRAEFKVALLASTRLTTRRALLQNILFELGLPYRDREEGELRLSLIDHLAPGPNCQRGMVLLVDEAHTLPVRLLEEIRMITNLMRDGQPRVRLVLAGGASLEERFASPRLESLNQRVATRCYLEQLTREETGAYVRQQIGLVGGDGHALLSDDAVRTIHTATDGIPRLINQLCDHALFMAAVGRVERLEPMHIEEAWADLQQLPVPFAEPAGKSQSSSIEFGQLSDEPTGAPAPAAALDVSAQLHSIEQQVAVANHDWPLEEHLAVASGEVNEPFIAPLPGGTEVELYFHGPHNPFAEKFQEEEVVLDRYAALDTIGRPRVSSTEGRELAQMMHPAAEAIPTPALTIARDYTEQEAAAEMLEHPLDDDFIDIVEPPLDGLLGDPPPDDRDILVIEEEAAHASPNSGRARRQEYKHLFAKLRRG